MIDHTLSRPHHLLGLKLSDDLGAAGLMAWARGRADVEEGEVVQPTLEAGVEASGAVGDAAGLF